MSGPYETYGAQADAQIASLEAQLAAATKPPVVPPVVPPVAPPTSLPPGTATLIFADDFSAQNFSHTQNGVSWIANEYVDTATGALSPDGQPCARFDEGKSMGPNPAPGATGWSELRFDGLANLPEVFVRYRVWFPSGTETPNSVGPLAKILGPSNDKGFRLWGGGNAGYGYGATPTQPYSNKVGFSSWGDGSGVNGYLGREYCYSAPGTQWGMGQGPSNTQHPSFIAPAYRGRWVELRMRFKEATAANNDGVIQLWWDGVLVSSDTALASGNIYHGPNDPKGYTTGYVFGTANNGWPQGQYVYVNGFRITTGGF